jgi:hypothetical protein
MKNYYVSVGSYELCIATNATCEEMEGEFIATCLDTGDRLRICGWLIDHIEPLSEEFIA